MARLTAKKEEWFSIPGDEDKAKVKIQHLTPGDLQKISANTSRWVGKQDAKSEFQSELEYQPLEQLKLTRATAIVDWENFFDADGNKLKCTRKNVELYLDHDPELGKGKDGKSKLFSEWIDEFRESIGKEVAPEEVLEKN